MADFSSCSWEILRLKIGIDGANDELDKRIKSILDTLRDIASVSSNSSLAEKVVVLKDSWFPAVDQYERTVLHLAALNGNTRLVSALINAGARINGKDGIGQTALTLALHMDHWNTAKHLIESGASVCDTFFEDTVSPLEIAQVKQSTALITQIEKKIQEENMIIQKVGSYFAKNQAQENLIEMNEVGRDKSLNNTRNYARHMNINVGDQKNTVTIQGCANRCPDLYGSHTPGGGDFHSRGYINESIARIAGHGGFWHVTEHVMKRPTVNPSSFKLKFKDNNYNNNEEALFDYDKGLSIAMIKNYEESGFFPSTDELKSCFDRTGSHNAVGKTNYRDEAFTQVVNTTAKWPLAYRKMYAQNRTVNLDGKKGRQLAGDEWVEDFLVRPIKQYASAQSSFSMVELMSCSTNLLEMNRSMYKSREAFDIQTTNKHKKPNSFYDQLKVAQFALKEDWFQDIGRTSVLKYPWADKRFKPGEQVPAKYINSYQKGDNKAKKEFPGFLHRKFPNDML